MKRTLFVLLLVTLLLCGCAREKTITVDAEARTVSDGTYAYQYEEKTQGEKHIVKIRYPDGVTYYWMESPQGFEKSYTGNFDRHTYTDGEILVEAITGNGSDQVLSQETVEKPQKDMKKILSKVIVIGPIWIIIGIWCAVSPYSAWMHSWRARRRGREPSERVLKNLRTLGIVFLVLGILITLGLGIYLVYF